MRILIINGPNLNLPGSRDKKHYGSHSLPGLKKMIQSEFPDIQFKFHQSNEEGEIINEIQGAKEEYDGIIINPGGFAHTSVAIRDALESIDIPKIEVHLSNLAAREDFRQFLITAGVCDGYISGFKELSYISAVYLLMKIKGK